jgi:hypothetical protein
MLLRGSTLIASVLAGGGRAAARWQMGAKTVQIYAPGGVWWSRKSVILRNAPYTIEAPHLGQIQARVTFGEIARRHKGERGFREGLPVIAYHIKTEMTGKRMPNSMRPEDYPSKKFRTIHTLEQLKRLEAEKRGAARPVAPVGLPP